MSETDTSREAVERDAEYWEGWAADIRANNGSVADAANMDAICARYRALLARAEKAEAENQRLRSALRACEGALDLHGKMYPAMVKGYTLDALNAARTALERREGS